jgi:hypothetical protein
MTLREAADIQFVNQPTRYEHWLQWGAFFRGLRDNSLGHQAGRVHPTHREPAIILEPAIE